MRHVYRRPFDFRARRRAIAALFPTLAEVTASLSVTLGAITLSGSATSAAPTASAGSLSSTLGAITLTGSATFVSASSSTGSLSSTLDAITLGGTATASAAGSVAGVLSATLGAITLTGSATTVAPTSSTGSLSATLGAITLVGVGLSSGAIEAESLLAAVRADYITEGLDSSAGNIYSLRAPRGFTLPHVVMTFATGGVATVTNTMQIDEGRLHFRIRATTAQEAREMAHLIDAWMLEGDPPGRRFEWTNGASGPVWRARHEKDRESHLTVNGDPVYVDLITYVIPYIGQA